MKKLIVVSDWVGDSYTVQEFRSATEGFLKQMDGARMSFVASTPSTIHTAYIIRQMVLTEERYGKPLETVLFQNTDPRIQATNGVQHAKGAEFVVMKLKSGMYICGPNAGYDFSLIKSSIDELFWYKNLDKGSQFRSRDLYARVSAHLMDEMEDEMDLEEISTNQIPELTGYHIGHIDNYGNIKTTINVENMKGKCEYGDRVNVSINDVTKQVTYVPNLFGGNPGDLVMYPGSSGDPDNWFLEISVWRHFTEKNPTTGLHEFNYPRPGMEILMK